MPKRRSSKQNQRLLRSASPSKLAVFAALLVVGIWGSIHLISSASTQPPRITMGSIATVIKVLKGGFSNLYWDSTGVIWNDAVGTDDSSAVPQRFDVRYRLPGQENWIYTPQQVDLTSSTTLADGRGLAINERTTMSSDGMTANLTVHILPTKLPGRTTTWQTTGGTLRITSPIRGGSRVYFGEASLIRSGDTLFAPYYLAQKNSLPGFSVGLAASTDGLHWETRGMIAQPSAYGSGYRSFTETGLVSMGSGVLYAISRHNLVNASFGQINEQPLAYAASTNNGASWSAPRFAKIGSSWLQYTARPRLLQLDANHFALTTGRPDNVIVAGLRSGNDISWRSKAVVYSNYPPSNRYKGSSGYLGGFVTSHTPNSATMLLTFDSCAPGWGCNTQERYSKTNQSYIYTRYVKISW